MATNNFTVDDFDYFLPEELIAQTPLSDRPSSRLLVLDKESGADFYKIYGFFYKVHRCRPFCFASLFVTL